MFEFTNIKMKKKIPWIIYGHMPVCSSEKMALPLPLLDIKELQGHPKLPVHIDCESQTPPDTNPGWGWSILQEPEDSGKCLSRKKRDGPTKLIGHPSRHIWINVLSLSSRLIQLYPQNISRHPLSSAWKILFLMISSQSSSWILFVVICRLWWSNG